MESEAFETSSNKEVHMLHIFDLIGTLALLIYAVASLLFPKFVAPYIAQTLDSPRGVAEFRVAHGGGYLAMSVFALIVNQPLVYMLLGMGWLGAAGARLLAIPLDRPPLNATYIASIVFELALGLMMIL
jgi:hypothetical protein